MSFEQMKQAEKDIILSRVIIDNLCMTLANSYRDLWEEANSLRYKISQREKETINP